MRNNARSCAARAPVISDLLNPEDAFRLLLQLAHDRATLRVQLDERPAESASIDPDSLSAAGFDLLTLLAQDAAAPPARVRIGGQREGAPFEIEAAVRGVAPDDASRILCAAPLRAALHERRAAPRFPCPRGVATSGAEKIVAVLHVPGEVMLCELVNISRLGLRLRLVTPEVSLDDEATVLYCEVRRGELLLQSRIHLRWKQMIRRHQELGARFLATDSAFENRLEHFVREIERHWLRHRRL